MAMQRFLTLLARVTIYKLTKSNWKKAILQVDHFFQFKKMGQKKVFNMDWLDEVNWNIGR